MKTCLNKMEKVRDTLLFQMESGQLRSGDRIPAEKVLGELNSVSRVTVRRALEALEREGHIRKKGRKGIFVENVPVGRPARQAKRNKMLAYVFFSSLHELMVGESTAVCRGMRKVAETHRDGLRLLEGHAFLALSGKERGSFDGLIVSGTNLRENLPWILALGIPTVVANAIPPGVKVDAVAVDHYEGGHVAAAALHHHGKRNLLFLGIRYEGEDFFQTSHINKYRGMKDYCFFNALPQPRCFHVLWRRGESVPTLSESAAGELAGIIADNGVDGVVCCSEILCRAVEALEARLGEMPRPQIATFSEGGRRMEDKRFLKINADMERLGFEAAELLYSRLNAPLSDMTRKLVPMDDFKLQ